MRITTIMDTHDIIDELKLDQIPGISVNFNYYPDSDEIVLTFDSLNDYKKLKLTGYIELIKEHYPVTNAVIIPRSYMDYFEYTDKVEYVCRHYDFL